MGQRKNFKNITFIIFLCVLLPFSSLAQVPRQMNFQGQLMNNMGRPANGSYNMVFALYEAVTGGSPLWDESQSVEVTDGIYNVVLGQPGNELTADFFTTSLYLGIKVGDDDEMLPRLALISAPFAIRAAVADSVVDGVIETIHLANDAVTGDKIDVGAVSSSHLQDGAALDEILDDDGDGSGLDADTLDGLQASAFLSTGSDYGRLNVASNLYEGSTALTDKYVDQNGDDMTGRLGASVTAFGSGWFESIKGSLIGGEAGAGVYGYATGNSTYGVRGVATGSSGVGVYGEASNTGFSTNYGGYFKAAGGVSRGVYGEGSVGIEGQGESIGVTGYGNNSGVFGSGFNYGISGQAVNTGAVENYGGYFTAWGRSGRGVYGYASNADGLLNHGGYFVADGELGRGVYGEASSTEGTSNYGGVFVSRGTSGCGVHGEADGINGLGVKGYVTGASGTGVSGYAANTGNVTNYGGHFTSVGATGRGVLGQTSGSQGVGVYGYASNSGNVYNWGGYFKADGYYGIGAKGYTEGYDGIGVSGKALGGSGIGVYAEAAGQYGRAFEGLATGTTGTNHGGYFEAHGPTGRGVFGMATGSSSTGVKAIGQAYDFYADGPGEDYGRASSIRWKKNIEEINGALNMVIQMRGVYFDWDEEHGGRHDLGFVAEEVGEHIPEIVVYEEDGEYANGMDYGKITPILLQAIKEQQDIISTLQLEMVTLKAEITAMKASR